MRTTEIKQDAVGFSVKTESPQPVTSSAAASMSSRNQDANHSCTHCKRKGHEAAECFLLHGYPDWFLEQQQQRQSQGRGRGGRNSTSGGRGRGRVNSASATTSNTRTSSQDQIATLISLLQSQNNQFSTDRLSGKTNLTDVILDTGASHYMTGDLSLLHDSIDIVPSAVTFPDGTASRATKIGRLRVTKDYSLINVLYVPNFNCTLISISKLLKQTRCIAIFTDTLCVLQDHFTRTLIGAGEERERGFTISKGSQLLELIRLEKKRYLLQFYGTDDLDILHTRCFLPYLCFLICVLI